MAFVLVQSLYPIQNIMMKKKAIKGANPVNKALR